MLLVLFLISGCVGFITADLNQLMDHAIELASESAPVSIPVQDISFEITRTFFDKFPFHTTLSITDISFYNPKTMLRISDVVKTKVSNQERLEMVLSLDTMVVNYGRYKLDVPLLGSFEGQAECRLALNSFGVSTYIDEDCGRTRVYVWPPKGNPRIRIFSDLFASRVLEFTFGLLGSGLFQDIISTTIIGDSLDNSVREPLTAAISEVFCGTHIKGQVRK